MRHLRRHVIEERRPEEESVSREPETFSAPAIDHEGRARLDAGVDVAAHLVAVRTVTSGPMSMPSDVPGPTFSARAFSASFATSASPSRADRDDGRDRHAALARGSVGGANQRVRGEVEVGVGQDHRVVLRAAERLHALAVARRRRVDVFRDRRRADERHRLDAGVVEDGVDRLLVAVHDVEDAVRQARLLEQFGHPDAGRRILFRRLQHEGVAARERDREHPERHHHREVERRDPGADAERLQPRVRVHAAADRTGVLAFEQVRRAGSELDHLDAALHRSHRVEEHFAVLLA